MIPLIGLYLESKSSKFKTSIWAFFRFHFLNENGFSPCSSSHNIAFGQDGLLANQIREGKEINEDSYELFDETHNCLENMAEIDEAHQEKCFVTIKCLIFCSPWSSIIVF